MVLSHFFFIVYDFELNLDHPVCRQSGRSNNAGVFPSWTTCSQEPGIASLWMSTTPLLLWKSQMLSEILILVHKYVLCAQNRHPFTSGLLCDCSALAGFHNGNFCVRDANLTQFVCKVFSSSRTFSTCILQCRNHISFGFAFLTPNTWLWQSATEESASHWCKWKTEDWTG